MSNDLNYIYSDFDDEVTFDLPTISECVFGNIQDAFNNVITAMIAVNLCTKLIICIPIFQKDRIADGIMILGGLLLIFYHFWDNLLLPIYYLLFISLGLVLSVSSLSNKTLWLYLLLSIGVNEVLVKFYSSDFFRLRIYFMCSTMKFIALHSSLKASNLKKVETDGLRIISYIFHPSSFPFCSYYQPSLSRSYREWSKFSMIWKCFGTLLMSFVFLGFSNCISVYLNGYFIEILYNHAARIFPLEMIHLLEKFSATYFTALEFRTSHYFICYLIQSTHLFWNNDIIVAKPLDVELPRSLACVVIAWDIPMHTWLKRYVFIPAKNKYGTPLSIFITYLASSCIHGFRFEIWSVLLSLGFLTWVEAMFRKILSREFNACLGIRPCTYQTYKSFLERMKTLFRFWHTERDDCSSGHKNTSRNSLRVVFGNFLLSLLTVFHLAYLGSSFDLSEEASSASYVLGTWESIGFYSHIIGILTLLIYCLIK